MHDWAEAVPDDSIGQDIPVKHGAFSQTVPHDMTAEIFGCRVGQECEGLGAEGTSPAEVFLVPRKRLGVGQIYGRTETGGGWSGGRGQRNHHFPMGFGINGEQMIKYIFPQVCRKGCNGRCRFFSLLSGYREHECTSGIVTAVWDKRGQ